MRSGDCITTTGRSQAETSSFTCASSIISDSSTVKIIGYSYCGANASPKPMRPAATATPTETLPSCRSRWWGTCRIWQAVASEPCGMPTRGPAARSTASERPCTSQLTHASRPPALPGGDPRRPQETPPRPPARSAPWNRPSARAGTRLPHAGARSVARPQAPAVSATGSAWETTPLPSSSRLRFRGRGASKMRWHERHCWCSPLGDCESLVELQCGHFVSFMGRTLSHARRSRNRKRSHCYCRY